MPNFKNSKRREGDQGEVMDSTPESIPSVDEALGQRMAMPLDSRNDSLRNLPTAALKLG
jgi:hypothetical protein